MTAEIVAKAPPSRIKPPRFIEMTCPHCGKLHEIDRALMSPCPHCDAAPGQPCVDMRSKAKGKIVALDKVHQQRVTHLGKLNYYASKGKLDYYVTVPAETAEAEAEAEAENGG